MASRCPSCAGRLVLHRPSGQYRCPACEAKSQAPPRRRHGESCTCFGCHYGEEAYQDWQRSGFTTRKRAHGPLRPGDESLVPVDVHGVALSDVPEFGIEEGTALAAYGAHTARLYRSEPPLDEPGRLAGLFDALRSRLYGRTA